MSAVAPWALVPERSRGRLHKEQSETMRGPRDAFQRDRDRIVHSISFRRLRHKTQVFMSPDGDHFRVRLTHSLEVAQIGRTIARALGLNEDLTEALCPASAASSASSPAWPGSEGSITTAIRCAR